ncbi:MAG: zinc ribbon domain-containing protein [Bacteroidetes bacterium]|nr:zinc ribbon domain-containing protein [Bacteroidota bacterium]
MYCTHCGNNNDADAQFCNNCGKPLIALQQSEQSGLNQNDLVSPNSNFQNNSGQGKLAALPPQLYGWNWGAFFLTWIWGIGNNTMIAFLTWIPLVNFVMIFMLGAKGNEWAWQNKHWISIAHFKKVQKLWAVWGFILFVFGMLFFLIVIVAAMDSY